MLHTILLVQPTPHEKLVHEYTCIHVYNNTGALRMGLEQKMLRQGPMTTNHL